MRFAILHCCDEPASETRDEILKSDKRQRVRFRFEIPSQVKDRTSDKADTARIMLQTMYIRNSCIQLPIKCMVSPMLKTSLAGLFR